MGLLEVDVIEDLMHSSSISKGIERTMEHIINELELDSMYIIRYEEGLMNPEISFDWENGSVNRKIDFMRYIDYLREWYHFDEQDYFTAKATEVLSQEEKEFYKQCGYEAVVEYQIDNHGNVVGYIILGWEHIKQLTEEEENSLHILLKLMSELLVKQFHKEVMGESDWRLFKLASTMTKTMFLMLDDEHRIQYINNYVKDVYPDIKVGEFCYQVLQGETEPCEDCLLKRLKENESVGQCKYLPYLQDSFQINACQILMSENREGYAVTLQKSSEEQPAERRGNVGRNFIFALDMIYKVVIAVEIRRDTFYNLLRQDMDSQGSYSMDFVLKWLSKLHLDDKQKFLECFDVNFLQNAYMNGVKSKELDFRYRTQEGNYHCMNARILFEYNMNKEAVAYILFTDVEQLRSAQLEEQRKMRDSLLAARSSAELKGELLANISHEIRTPMSGIVSMSSVAKQVYQQEDKLLECLNNIDEYAEHMMQVMDSLLETVKVDNNAIVIAKQPFQLEGFLNRIDIAARGTIEKKNVQFYIDNQCRYNQLLGDEIRLYQALSTLLKNAISYTPISGSIRLTAKQIATDTKKVYIRFIIEDTGNGLTKKMKESIFGFQHSADDGLIDEEHFELSLAAKIIRLMGGDISITVNSNGSRLYFTLPFELHEEEKGKNTKKRTAPAVDDFKGKRVLLAEDSEMGQDALRAVLEVVGFEVDTVENGKKAVISFISQPAFTYDVILMDVHMPFMDGREATRCIRISGKEDGKTIPVIGLMANTYDEDVKESLEAGMQAHLAKPVDVDKLYRVLEKVVLEKENR